MQPLEVAVTRSGHAVAGARTIEASEILENLELKHTYVEYESDDLYWKYVNAAVLSVVLESYFSAKAVYPAPSDSMPRHDTRPGGRERRSGAAAAANPPRPRPQLRLPC